MSDRRWLVVAHITGLSTGGEFLLRAENAEDAAEQALRGSSVFAHRRGVMATVYPVSDVPAGRWRSQYSNPEALSFRELGERVTERIS